MTRSGKLAQANEMNAVSVEEQRLREQDDREREAGIRMCMRGARSRREDDWAAVNPRDGAGLPRPAC